MPGNSFIDLVALQLGLLAAHWYGVTYLAAFGLFYFLANLHLWKVCTTTDPTRV